MIDWRFNQEEKKSSAKTIPAKREKETNMETEQLLPTRRLGVRLSDKERLVLRDYLLKCTKDNISTKTDTELINGLVGECGLKVTPATIYQWRNRLLIRAKQSGLIEKKIVKAGFTTKEFIGKISYQLGVLENRIAALESKLNGPIQ